MKKLVTLCVGALLLSTTFGVLGTAKAQSQPASGGAASGPFADVPTDHWAYQAVTTLQNAGIVIGYPDGTYGGRRAMTRYEFAVAIARLLPLINSNAASKSDLAALQQDMENRLQQNQAALDALRSLVDEFQPELQQLGQDVAAVKSRLDALEQRVAVLEAEQRRVKITGDVNFIARGNVNTSKTDIAPLDQDGYRAGDAGTDYAGTTTAVFRRPSVSDYYYDEEFANGDATGPGYYDSSGETTGNTSLGNDLEFYNDVLLTIDGRVSDNAHAIIKLEGGDYAPFLGSLTAIDPERINGLDTAGGFGGIDEDEESSGFGAGTWVDIYEAYLDLPVSLGPLTGADAQVGRFGNQFTKYTLQAYNPDSYASTPETSSGDFPMDGAKLTFSAGPAHVQLYAAKNDLSASYVDMLAGPSISATSGPFRPGSIIAGGINYDGLIPDDGSSESGDGEITTVDQSGGARVTFGNPNDWVVGVTGVLARVDDFGDANITPLDPYQFSKGKSMDYDTLAIYGADFNGVLPFFGKSGLTLNGEFAQSDTGDGSHYGNVNSNGANQAWEANLGWATGPFSIKGGYQEVYANFGAPGNWGHVGTWINPVNIKGPTASANYAITHALALTANADWYEGAEDTPAGLIDTDNAQSPLTNPGDKLNHYEVGLKYGLTSQYNVDLGYEYDEWQLDDRYGYLGTSLTPPGTHFSPTEQYITIGVGHSFNKNASVKVLYQILTYDDKSSGFDGATEAESANNTNGKENGGVAVTQFSLKF